MTGTDAAWPPDVGFVEYVQARQHTLLRATYLVCGDLSVAQSLLRTALVDLARHWDRVRDDGPDLHVRRVLYRAAVRSGAGEPLETPGPPAAGDGGDATPWDATPWDVDEVERRLDVRRALGALTPQQRATVVLRYFEDRAERDTADILGCSVATARTEAHEALAALRDAMPKVDLRVGGPW